MNEVRFIIFKLKSESMKSSFIAFVFLHLFAAIKCECKFTVEQVEEETRIVAIVRSGELEILNEAKIRSGEVLYFICSENDVVRVKCQRNRQFSRTLPIQNCPTPLKAVAEEVVDGTCSFPTYRVGYRVGSGFLELYRSCFNKNELASVSTSHTAVPNSLVTRRPDSTFTTDGIMTLKDAASYQAKRIFTRFGSLLGLNQLYIRSPTDLVIDRGHLAPSADFLFPVNMRATFKYINAIPQFSTINRGNWKSIEEFVRKYIESIGKARILTGAYGVLKLQDGNGNLVPMYLTFGNRNPIPLWMYKVIDAPKGTIVFMTLNNVFDPTPPEPVCEVVPCPIQLKNSHESGYTYCCDPNDFATNIFPNVH